ncbi:Holliday junction resolvase RuvX [Demequina litorisediminis]|uniref:Holliday junction resolvase RuvX n=1 Tax=Demequina litorisediminis TaxID=1849022 RepID=UPI0032AFF550
MRSTPWSVSSPNVRQRPSTWACRARLSGAQGASAEDARAIATAVAERCEAVVRLVDERFSTATASASMRQAGRNAKQQRQVIDQAAAVVILESALDIERRGNLSKVTETIPREGGDD